MCKVRIGIVGCGGMGMSLARAVAAVEGAELAACFDKLREKADAVAEEVGGVACNTYEDLLRNEGIDAVVVASPQFMHAELAIAAARAGKHVFCEKPMALTVGDCRRMIDEAAVAGIKLMVGQVLRYYSPWRCVIEMVREGRIGEPFGIIVTRMGGGPESGPETWRHRKGLSGGVLMETSAHEFDFIRQIMGEVGTVYASVGRYTRTISDYPDLHYVNLRFQRGGIGVLQTGSACALPEVSGKIQGTQGAMAYDKWGGAVRLATFGGEVTEIPCETPENPVHRELREFVQCIRDDTPPTIPGEEGMKAVEIAEAAYLSAERGAPVDLPLQNG